MSDLLPADLPVAYLIAAAIALLLFVAWLLYRRRATRRLTLKQVIRAIAFEHLSDIVIPNADEGEIHIDHLLLTAEGLLVIDVKNVQGIVFGSDKMQDWTVIAADRRYTFGNPQPALYDRIAAVSAIVRQVPVSGRLVFLDGAEFTKGVPQLVCNLGDLMREFGEADRTGAAAKIDAFKPHWELMRRQARVGERPPRRGRPTLLRS